MNKINQHTEEFQTELETYLSIYFPTLEMEQVIVGLYVDDTPIFFSHN